MISIAYLDPGNLETDLQAGAQFDYKLAWVRLSSPNEETGSFLPARFQLKFFHGEPSVTQAEPEGEVRGVLSVEVSALNMFMSSLV